MNECDEETRRSYSVYSFYCFVIHLHTNIFKIRLTKQNSGHIRCSLFATIKRTCSSIQISLAALSFSLSLSLSLFVRLKYYTNSAASLDLSRPPSEKQSIHNESFGVLLCSICGPASPPRKMWEKFARRERGNAGTRIEETMKRVAYRVMPARSLGSANRIAVAVDTAESTRAGEEKSRRWILRSGSRG